MPLHDISSSQPSVLPVSVHSFGFLSVAQEAFASLAAFTFSSYNSPAQYQAAYIPFSVPFTYPVARVFWCNGSAAGGNMDFGIYDLAAGGAGPGAARFRTGPTAATGNSVLQFVTATFSLPPGTYYFAIQNDSATLTNRFIGMTAVTTFEGRLAGLQQQLVGSSGLPSTATGAQWASNGYPMLGITRLLGTNMGMIG